MKFPPVDPINPFPRPNSENADGNAMVGIHDGVVGLPDLDVMAAGIGGHDGLIGRDDLASVWGGLHIWGDPHGIWDWGM